VAAPLLVLAMMAACGGDRRTASPATRGVAAGELAGSLTAGRAPRGPAEGQWAADAALGGTVVIATAGDAETLFPPLAVGMTARQVTDLIFEPLAELGEAMNTVGDAGFQPRLARSWTWAADSLAIAFHLDPRARWHDGAPVTAEDVRFTFGVYRDPAVGSPSVGDVAAVDSVTVRDAARTAVFWFSRRSPEQFYVAAARLRILPAHLLARVPSAELGRWRSEATRPRLAELSRLRWHTPQARHRQSSLRMKIHAWGREAATATCRPSPT
jgi:peptide/nickel transport system substrate-binding protein